MPVVCLCACLFVFVRIFLSLPMQIYFFYTRWNAFQRHRENKKTNQKWENPKTRKDQKLKKHENPLVEFEERIQSARRIRRASLICLYSLCCLIRSPGLDQKNCIYKQIESKAFPQLSPIGSNHLFNNRIAECTTSFPRYQQVVLFGTSRPK